MPHLSHNPSSAHSHDIAYIKNIFTISVSESLTVEDDVARQRSIGRSVTESFTVDDIIAGLRKVPRSIIESLEVTDDVVRVIDVFRSLSETFSIEDAVVKSWHTIRSLIEGSTIAIASVAIHKVTARYINETVTIDVIVDRARDVICNLSVSLSIDAVANRVTDQARTLLESFTIEDAVERTKVGVVIINVVESLTITATAVKSIFIKKVLADSTLLIANLDISIPTLNFFQRIMNEPIVVNTSLSIRACWLSVNKGPVPIIIKKVGRFFTRLPQQSAKPYTYRNKFTRYRKGDEEIR